MTIASVHAAAFYRDVTQERTAWTLRDARGFPAPQGDGSRAMPFWSSRSRVERITETVPAYAGFSPIEIPLADFLERWLPGLERDGLKAGLNWSGERATGYDVDPRVVAAGIGAAGAKQQS